MVMMNLDHCTGPPRTSVMVLHEATGPDFSAMGDVCVCLYMNGIQCVSICVSASVSVCLCVCVCVCMCVCV